MAPQAIHHVGVGADHTTNDRMGPPLTHWASKGNRFRETRTISTYQVRLSFVFVFLPPLTLAAGFQVPLGLQPC